MEDGDNIETFVKGEIKNENDDSSYEVEFDAKPEYDDDCDIKLETKYGIYYFKK